MINHIHHAAKQHIHPSTNQPTYTALLHCWHTHRGNLKPANIQYCIPHKQTAYTIETTTPANECPLPGHQ